MTKKPEKPEDTKDTEVSEVIEATAEVVTEPQVSDDQDEAVAAEPEDDQRFAPLEDPVADPPVVEPVQPVAPAAKRPVFVPLVLGGLVAGAVGYVIAMSQYPDPGPVIDPAIVDRVAALEAIEPVVLPEAVDLSPLEAAIAGLTQTQDAQAADIAAQLADFDARLTAVEKQPSGDGTLQEAAIAAYERDIAELRDQINLQQASLADMTSNATALLESTRSEALAIEENAVAAARNATARASLARVQGAIETGAPLGSIVGDLESALGQPAPQALVDAVGGVPTLAQLQAEFPDAARAALQTARAEGASGEATSGFGAFLRNQLDVRSVAPQDGDSVDAILSRAGAALREGRLNDTLAETATLPEVARAAMVDWLSAAETRAAAIDAADTLATSLTDN